MRRKSFSKFVRLVSTALGATQLWYCVVGYVLLAVGVASAQTTGVPYEVPYSLISPGRGLVGPLIEDIGKGPSPAWKARVTRQTTLAEIAEYLSVPESLLHQLNPDLPDTISNDTILVVPTSPWLAPSGAPQ